MKSGLVAAGVALLCAAFPIAANADIVLPAQGSSVECNSNNPGGDVSGGSTCALQGATASLSLAPFVSLQARVDEAPGVATENAFADLTYYFEVVGGTAGTSVPVFIDTNLLAEANPPSTDTTEGNYASAALFTSGAVTDNSVLVCVGADECTAPEFDGGILVTAASGSAVEIHLSIAAEENYFSGGSVFASADPYIFVDPNFANASDYSIVVSDGVANALPPAPPSPAPEPGAWAMLLTGLLILGTVRVKAQR